MADRTAIEWTDATWNPIRARRVGNRHLVGWHCTHVSEGCRNCYAEGVNRRLGTGFDYKPGHAHAIEVFLDEKTLAEPLHWRRPRRIFVCSMTDLFADFVTDDMIDRVFAVAALCPQHTFQILTKRPERMRAYINDARVAHRIARVCVDLLIDRKVNPGDDWPVKSIGDIDDPDDIVLGQWPLPNVWAGTSVEDQATADARIPDLLATPAAVRWISAEPLLGPLDVYGGDPDPRLGGVIAGPGLSLEQWWRHDDPPGSPPRPGLDWVVVGGESGPKARPMHPDWVRSLRDQCKAAGVPFLMKQWGEWLPWQPDAVPLWVSQAGIVEDQHNLFPVDFDKDPRWDDGLWAIAEGYDHAVFEKVGKKRAGRLLDGREWNEFPEVRP